MLCFSLQKKSREESTGSESGVEILKNEPYIDGPGGNGQYTFKIYHVGSHLPGNHFIHVSQYVVCCSVFVTCISNNKEL